MADIVCVAAIGLGIVRQAEFVVSTMCILYRSAAHTDLAHRPEYIAELCPCVDLTDQHVGRLTPLLFCLRRDIGIR